MSIEQEIRSSLNQGPIGSIDQVNKKNFISSDDQKFTFRHGRTRSKSTVNHSVQMTIVFV